MKKLRLHRLERHRVGETGDGMQLAYKPPCSATGKVYCYSPNPAAVPRLFLIGGVPVPREISEENRSRARREPGPGATVCPYSGYVAPDSDFVHPDDIDAVIERIMWDFSADVDDWLAGVVRDFNKQQSRNTVLTTRMDLNLSRGPEPVAIREDLLRGLECDVCGRSYGVYAIALFCPDCGAGNVTLHFQRETELVSQQVSQADHVSVEGDAELAYRLMGNAHEDVLTAFEATLKTVYRYLVRARAIDKAELLCSQKEIGNAFQNLRRTRRKYAKLGIDPFAETDAADFEFLEVNVQKRHVIGHNLGVADEYYGELTQTDQPGETVTVIGAEVRRFANICLDVVRLIGRELDPS